MLEANLIKQLRPRYNVLLRDDKSLPYILVTEDERGAQLTKHRGARNRKGRYFGPFASVWAVNRTMTALQTRLPPAHLLGFLFRQPLAPLPAPNQIKRCAGPCTGDDRAGGLRDAHPRGGGFPLRQKRRGGGSRVKERLSAEMQEASGRPRIRAGRALSRPSGRALGHPVEPGGEHAERRGGRCRRHRGGRADSSASEVFFFPQLAETGATRALFSQGRQVDERGGSAHRLPRAVLFRQAARRSRSCSRTNPPEREVVAGCARRARRPQGRCGDAQARRAAP